MWRTFPPQKSENVRRHSRNSIENAILLYSNQTWKCDPIQRHIPISLYKEVTSRSSVYGNDFGVLEVLCEDGECYISWHVFVTRSCNKLFRFSYIRLILLIAYISQASFIQRMFSDGLRVQRSTKIWRSKIRLLPQRSPQGSRMVQYQGGSVEFHTCRRSEGLPERNIGDVIQPALSNQKTWWCLGCQWLQQCGVLQEH